MIPRPCPRCGRLAVLRPWPFSRGKPRYIQEACAACVRRVQEAVDRLEDAPAAVAGARRDVGGR